MALARKGSRRITVEGVPYRWAFAPDDGYMVLVVESAGSSGQRVEAFFRYHDLHEPAEAGVLRIVGQRRSISPGVVRQVILAALGRGWQPSQRGLPAFRVDDAEHLVPLGKPEAGPPRRTRPGRWVDCRVAQAHRAGPAGERFVRPWRKRGTT